MTLPDDHGRHEGPDPLVPEHAIAPEELPLPVRVAIDPPQTAADTAAADLALLASVEALTKQVEKLAPDVTNLKTEGKRSWAWIRGGMGFIAFDVVITIMGIIFGVVVLNIANQSEATAASAALAIHDVQLTQTRIESSIHEQCTLYAEFLSFYSAKAKMVSPQGPEAYDQAFRNLLTSADHLQCGLSAPKDLPPAPTPGG